MAANGLCKALPSGRALLTALKHGHPAFGRLLAGLSSATACSVQGNDHCWTGALGRPGRLHAAKRAVTLAAAGGANILMIGPAGTGETVEQALAL